MTTTHAHDTRPVPVPQLSGNGPTRHILTDQETLDILSASIGRRLAPHSPDPADMDTLCNWGAVGVVLAAGQMSKADLDQPINCQCGYLSQRGYRAALAEMQAGRTPDSSYDAAVAVSVADLLTTTYGEAAGDPETLLAEAIGIVTTTRHGDGVSDFGTLASHAYSEIAEALAQLDADERAMEAETQAKVNAETLAALTELAKLPADAQAALIDCIGEDALDEARFGAVAAEHCPGLDPAQRERLVDEAIAAYVVTKEPAGGWPEED